jgi:hypothetical protein
MKILARIFAFFIASAAATAHASTYYITGQQTAAYANSTTIVTTPAQPSFTGSLALDTASSSLSGNFNFAPYSIFLTVYGVLSGNIYHTNSSYTIAGGTTSYDPATHTWTLNNGSLQFTGTAPGCNGHSAICAAHARNNTLTLDSLVLTLSEDFSSLSGTLLSTQQFNHLSQHYTWTFQSAVPLPAAAWLFGSALLGLGAGARRQRVTQKC